MAIGQSPLDIADRAPRNSEHDLCSFLQSTVIVNIPVAPASLGPFARPHQPNGSASLTMS